MVLTPDTLLPNRQYQGVGGYHAIRAGGSASYVTNNCKVLRVAIKGAPGYGIGWQGSGAFTNILCSDVFIDECDSDGSDFKNRAFSTEDNHTIVWLNPTVNNIGLGKVGVDVAGFALGASPLTTTNLSSVVTVAHTSHAFQVGTTVTLAGGTTFNGINFSNVTGVIASRATNSYTVDFGQIASGTGSGGGSSVIEYAAQPSTGDAGIDLRGRRCFVLNAKGKGDFNNRTFIRLRSGELTGIYAVNGLGAWDSVVSGYSVENTGVATSSTAVFDGGHNNVITGGVARGFGFNIYTGPTAKGTSITGCMAEAGLWNIFLNGEDATVSGCGATNCATSFEVQGGDTYNTGDFPDDAFSTTISSTTVVATLTGHGFSTSDVIGILSASNLNGVVINGSRTITVLTPDTFSFTVTPTATATGSGGGGNAIWTAGTSAHNSLNNSFANCTSRGASIVGFKTTSRSVDSIFHACQSAGDLLSYSDSGVNTIWRSPQFADLKRNIALPTAGTTSPTTLTMADSGKVFTVPSNATEQAVLNLPPAVSGKGFSVTVKSRHASLGFKIGCAAGGTRIGSVGVSSGAYVTIADLGGAATIEWDTTSGYSASSYIGTPT